ncbi:hypothetical protein Mapa_013634 [Marchantia paleacea]|nr:hypothetical protein Mapa_013634 [Marchantia paleacea]
MSTLQSNVKFSASSHQHHIIDPSTCKKANDNVYELYKPKVGGVTMQVLFFHGLQSEGCVDSHLQTWVKGDGSSSCWLNTWLIKHFPQAQIFSISYDSCISTSATEGRMDMYQNGETLAYSLIKLARIGQTCPVVLVGHCVGGLVLKKTCLIVKQMMHSSVDVETRNYYQQFLRHVRAVVFYSTPQAGFSLKRNWIKRDKEGPLLKYLDLLNKESSRINHWFQNLRRRYGWRTYGLHAANEINALQLMPNVNNVWFPPLHNMKKWLFASQTDEEISVSEATNRIDIDNFLSISYADHFNISKPKSQKSNNFLFLVDALREIEGKNGDVRLRFQEILCLPPKLLRVHDRIDEVIRILDLKDPSPIILALVGMEGLGKSTLARQVVLDIHHNFEYICYMELEDLPRPLKEKDLKKRIIDNLVNNLGEKIQLTEDRTWSTLKGKKNLFVADNVQFQEDIYPFLDSTFGGEGSRLIITSSIQNWRKTVRVYDVKVLSQQDSQSLFKLFFEDSVLHSIPTSLVFEAVEHCGGLPLTIKVLGSHLSSKDDHVSWTSLLRRFRTDYSMDGKGENKVWSKLRVVFDQLSLPERELFLDLAAFDYFPPNNNQNDCITFECTWDDKSKYEGIEFRDVITNLQNNSFLEIASVASLTSHILIPVTSLGVAKIHKTLREMGKWISRDTNSSSWRAMWESQKIQSMLLQKEVNTWYSRRLEVLSVAMKDIKTSSTILQWSSLSDLESLRLLRISDLHLGHLDSKLMFPRSLTMLHMINCSQTSCSWTLPGFWPIQEGNIELLNRLSVIILDNCSPVLLPTNFHRLENLQTLSIHEDEEDINTNTLLLPHNFGLLPTLKYLSLSASFTTLPDSFLQLSLLQSLTLEGCTKWMRWPIPRQVSYSGYLTSLVELNLIDCLALKFLPAGFGEMRSLQSLNIRGCSSLQELPEEFGKLKRLIKLDICGCRRLKHLGESFHNLNSLEILSLLDLPALQRLPNAFGNLPVLERMLIGNCKSLSVSARTFAELQALYSLSIFDCSGMEYFWHGFAELENYPKPNRLNSVEILHQPTWNAKHMLSCVDQTNFFHYLTKLPFLNELTIPLCSHENLINVHFPSQQYFSKSEKLKLGFCGMSVSLLESLGQLRAVVTLHLDHCYHLKMLPESIGNLSFLRNLKLSGCCNLAYLPESLGQLVALEEIILTECYSLVTLPESFGKLVKLKQLILSGCHNLASLPECLDHLVALRYITFVQCHNLKRVPESIGHLLALKSFQLTECISLSSLPESLGHLLALERFSLTDCISLSILPESLGQLLALKYLQLFGCNKILHLPESLGRLLALKVLRLSGCNLVALPESLGQLLELEEFELTGCHNLEQIPESLGHLPALKSLTFDGCHRLLRLPGSLGQFKGLEELFLWECHSLHYLPESLSGLKALRVLILSGCRSWVTLPRFVFELKSLQVLDLHECHRLESLPETLADLQGLRALTLDKCHSLQSLPDSLGDLKMLIQLRLWECHSLVSLPESLGNLQMLTELALGECHSLVSLPESLGNLQMLTELALGECHSLVSLPESLGNLQMLTELTLRECHSLLSACTNQQNLPELLAKLKELNRLDISASKGVKIEGILRSLQELAKLTTIKISRCDNFEEAFESWSHLKSLTKLSIGHCDHSESLPQTFRELTALGELSISSCRVLKRLPECLGQLRGLHSLTVEDCDSLQELPDSLGQLQVLSTLTIRNCGSLQALPFSLGQLKGLSLLTVENCDSLQELPDSLGQLQVLSILTIRNCGSLQALPFSLGQLPRLRRLIIENCGSLQELPFSLGQLKVLSELTVENCGNLQELPDCVRQPKVPLIRRSNRIEARINSLPWLKM